jgi:hypothetical protein
MPRSASRRRRLSIHALTVRGVAAQAPPQSPPAARPGRGQLEAVLSEINEELWKKAA